jgi:hypothetical protein
MTSPPPLAVAGLPRLNLSSTFFHPSVCIYPSSIDVALLFRHPLAPCDPKPLTLALLIGRAARPGRTGFPQPVHSTTSSVPRGRRLCAIAGLRPCSHDSFALGFPLSNRSRSAQRPPQSEWRPHSPNCPSSRHWPHTTPPVRLSSIRTRVGHLHTASWLAMSPGQRKTCAMSIAGSQWTASGLRSSRRTDSTM